MADDPLFRVLEAIENVAPTDDVPAVAGITDDELFALLAALYQRRWITASAYQGRKVLRGQVLGLTPAGTTALKGARDAQDADMADEADLSVAEKRERRTLFMKSLYKLTSGNTSTVIDSSSVGAELGWEDTETKPVVAYLRSKGLIAYRALGGRISITQDGVDETEDALDDPATGTENLAPMNVTIGELVGGTVQLVQGGIATASTVPTSTAAAKPDGWWRGVSIEATGAVVGGILLLLITGALTDWFGLTDEADRDPTPPTTAPATTTTTTTTSTAVAGSTTTCAIGPCTSLRVANTVEGGRDIGAYIRSTPHEVATRLTGVFGGTKLFGVCVFGGGFEAVPGETLWVKTPFAFVDGDVAADGTFNSPQSRPSPTSTDHGWISATFLAPPEAVAALPKCPDSA